MTFGNSIFDMTSGQKADALARRAPATPAKGHGQVPSGEPDEKAPEKPVNLTRERPILHRSVETSLRRIKADLEKSLEACGVAHTAYREYPSELKTNDRALVSFCRVMQFRQETVARCMGFPDGIVHLVPDSSLVGGPGNQGDQSTGGSVAAPSSPTQSQMTGAAPYQAEAQQATRNEVSWEDFLKEARTMNQKFWDGDLKDIMPIEEVHTLMEHILEAKDPAEFLALKKTWQAYEKAAGQIGKGAKQGAEDVCRHMKVKAAENTREKKRKADADAKAELQKVKDEAKAAAEAIKKRKLQSEEKSDPLYSLDMPPDVAPEVETLEHEKLHQTDWRLAYPWKLAKCDSANVCLSHGKMQKALSFWGAQYKKTMSQSKLTQVTYPVDEKSGLEEANKFFGEIIQDQDRPDISTVPGGAAFMKAVWLFGCASELKQATFLPNNAALMKMLVVGEVRHILVEWKSFCEALAKLRNTQQPISAEEAMDALTKLDADTLVRLFKFGAVLRQCTLQKLEVLFIPMGWLSVEIAGACSFIYGLRKSCFVKGSGNAYKDAIDRTEKAGKTVDRMKAIHAILEQAEATEAKQ